MQSLFEKNTADVFIARINRLTPQTVPLWGKMNVAQMLSHCQKPLEIASGKLKPKTNRVIKFLFGKKAKEQLLKEPQFKKNLPTFPEAKIVEEKEFETEKRKLIQLIEQFQRGGEAGLTNEPHPFFGELSVEEWNVLMVKHLDHHLRQFGV